jgi:predicted GNAT family acetyltransferase
MQLHRFDNSKTFWERTSAFLSQHEAEHNLLLGIIHTLLHDPDRYPHAPYLATVEVEGDLVAVALQTPPYNLVLSKVKDLAAITLIAKDLASSQASLPGVGGLVAEAERFAQTWQELTSQTYKLPMQMRIHQLTAVQPVAIAQGYLRLAAESDRPLMVEWYQAFADEAIASFGVDTEHLVDIALRQQSFYLWQDSVPVSFSCKTQYSPSAARIGPVYTPPEYRRKGYATACVATLSQQLLDEGCHGCFIFTDLANPTSNHIYQEIGYRPICDWLDYSFISNKDEESFDSGK